MSVNNLDLNELAVDRLTIGLASKGGKCGNVGKNRRKAGGTGTDSGKTYKEDGIEAETNYTPPTRSSSSRIRK